MYFFFKFFCFKTVLKNVYPSSRLEKEHCTYFKINKKNISDELARNFGYHSFFIKKVIDHQANANFQDFSMNMRYIGRHGSTLKKSERIEKLIQIFWRIDSFWKWWNGSLKSTAEFDHFSMKWEKRVNFIFQLHRRFLFSKLVNFYYLTFVLGTSFLYYIKNRGRGGGGGRGVKYSKKIVFLRFSLSNSMELKMLKYSLILMQAKVLSIKKQIL